MDQAKLEQATKAFNVIQYHINEKFSEASRLSREIAKRVEEVGSLEICSMICLDDDMSDVNAWTYYENEATCVCLQFESLPDFSCLDNNVNEKKSMLNVKQTQMCFWSCEDGKEYLF